jgi:hypothetical protein
MRGGMRLDGRQTAVDLPLRFGQQQSGLSGVDQRVSQPAGVGLLCVRPQCRDPSQQPFRACDGLRHRAA